MQKVTKNLEGKKASKNIKQKLILEATEIEKKFGLKKLERNSYFFVNKLKIKEASKKNNYFIEFSLSRGEYATVFLEFLKKFLE